MGESQATSHACFMYTFTCPLLMAAIDLQRLAHDCSPTRGSVRRWYSTRRELNECHVSHALEYCENWSTVSQKAAECDACAGHQVVFRHALCTETIRSTET